MIRAYDETWQMYVRLTELTCRRPDVKPLMINKTLLDFLEDNKSRSILDMGCGENNLSMYYPNIHGLDRTIEADTYGFVSDIVFDLLPEFECGIAVNSLHWGDIESNIERSMSKCKTMWISLNENHPIDEFKSVDKWKNYGNVEYFWHGQKQETRSQIKHHLDNDHLYHYLAKQHNRSLDQDTDAVFQNTVMNDPFYGVVRVILSRT